MDSAKVLEELKSIWTGDDRLMLVKVDPVEYVVDGRPDDPHPFMIGPAHVAYASDHCCGMLGEAAIDASKVGCYWPDKYPRCNLPYSAHHTKYGLFVQLTADLDEKVMMPWLAALKPAIERLGVSGVAFMGTKEFAILRDGVAVCGRGANG